VATFGPEVLHQWFKRTNVRMPLVGWEPRRATIGLFLTCIDQAPVPVRTHCTSAWWNRCKTDLNSFPRRKLDETTGTSSYYMDENHSAGSEIQRPRYGRRSWHGSEPSTLEIDVYVRRYALLVVLARNDDDDVVIVIRLSEVCPCCIGPSVLDRLGGRVHL